MSARAPFTPDTPLEPGITLLEASAGTGKTYSITTIVLRLVVEYGVPIDRILAVTFTNAATAELTSRIRKRLGEAERALALAARGLPQPRPEDEVLARLLALDADRQLLAERARLAVEAFDRAHVSTIHGFCQQMLLQHALYAQVPFGATLIEDQLALVQDLAQDFWALRLERLEPFELQLLTLAGIDLASLTRLAQLAVDHWDATPTPSAPATPRPDATGLVAALERAAELARAPEARARLTALLAGRRGFVKPDEDARVVASLEPLSRGVPRQRDLDHLAQLHRGRLALELPDTPLPPLVDAVTTFLDEYARWRPLAQGWVAGVRHELVDHVRRGLLARSRERGEWTYDALLRSLRDALDGGPSPLAEALRATIGGRFDAVLIDEFQDTDPIQWQIFSRLFATPAHRVFLIGDPKQAIYAFRRADVRTYLAARRAAHRELTLSTNRRSDGPLVQALNRLFMRRDAERVFTVPGIAYQEVAAVADRRVEPAVPPVRVCWIERNRRNTGRPNPLTSRITSRWAEDELPAIVASDVVRTLRSGVQLHDAGGPRAVRPSDLAVLVTRNRQAERMQEALRQVGVPAVVHGPHSVFATEEATELLRVLRAVLDPARVPLVRRALLTRLVGFTAEELARLEQEAPRALEEWIDRLREWRDIWHKRSFIEAFRRLTSLRGEALLALHDGERRLANTLQLGELLHLAAAQRALEAPGLVAWLERRIRRADSRDERELVRLETDEPAVQIVTVHKAKGLEYPFVWCPYLWQAPFAKLTAGTNEFVFRRPPRPGPAHAPGHETYHEVGLELGVDPNAPDRRAHQALHLYDDRAERLRTLYVALTRAKHQVIVHAGMFWDLPESALGQLLFGPATGTDPASVAREVDQVKRALAGRSDDELRHLAARDLPPDLVSFEVAAPASPERLPAPGEGTRLAARRWETGRTLDLAWRRTSFSGLIAEIDEDHLQAASDEDRLPDAAPLSEVTPPAPILLAGLPSGRTIGNCIHKIFELHDFRDTDRGRLEALVRAELEHFGLGLEHAPALTEAIDACLDTPLDDTGFRLRELPRERRLSELAFVFPVLPVLPHGGHALQPRELVACFRDHGPPQLARWVDRLDGLRFEDLRGFLSGSLDLAFRHPRDERWYVLDWKSNHLGKTAADYTRPAMQAAMDQHHYHLQYHLYAVALTRYLRHRLGPAFDPARDLGGALYLFIRGLHPSHAPGTGAYLERPSPALLAALDRALGPMAAPPPRAAP